MSLDFVKVGIGKAENSKGSIVRVHDRELLRYEVGDFAVLVEIYFEKENAVIYHPQLPETVPLNMSAATIFDEILAGAEVVAQCPTRWGD